jgi:hypothetical protein
MQKAMGLADPHIVIFLPPVRFPIHWLYSLHRQTLGWLVSKGLQKIRNNASVVRNLPNSFLHFLSIVGRQTYSNPGHGPRCPYAALNAQDP